MITLPFKQVSPLYEMAKSGEMPFTVRKIDYLDSRFAILKQRMERAYIGDDLAIQITNPATSESFTRKLRLIEHVRLSPGWMILYLGDIVKS